MAGSDFYGIHNTLLHYAGLPKIGSFPFAVQHGWQPGATRYEADTEPAEIWVWSERMRRELSAFYPPDRIRVTGSPYLYLDEIERPAAVRESLYVLPHSTHLDRIGFSHDDLRNLLISIGDADGSCDVLAYYLDVNQKLCETLSSTRSRIVVNGGLWSADFLQTVRRNLHLYKRVYFSDFGSAVLFARHEGLETTYANLSIRLDDSSCPYNEELRIAGGYDLTGAGQDTYQELGISHRLSRLEMRRLIIRGLRHKAFEDLCRGYARNLRNRFLDYRRHVRPNLALVRLHNEKLKSGRDYPSV